MPRSRKLQTFSDFQRALKYKYGIGEREGYKPWIRVQDVPSIGHSGKIEGLKVRRIHHTLSEAESCFFYLAEFSDKVIDIREQFPLLPIELTIKIAKLLDVAHPTVPKSQELNVMTTDFVLTCSDHRNKIWYEAIAVKKEEALEDPRTSAKLDIERIWWQLIGVPFHVFVDTEDNKIKSKNIEWFTTPFRKGFSVSDKHINTALKSLNTGPIIIEQFCSAYSNTLSIDESEALLVLKALVVNKHIDIALDKPIVETGVFEVTDIHSEREKKYAG